MRPVTVMAPAPAPEPAAGCWYAEVGHRPRVGWCPAACQGLVTYAERVGDGGQRLYCEGHGHWRRRTVRLPTLVRRLPSAPQPGREPAPTR